MRQSGRSAPPRLSSWDRFRTLRESRSSLASCVHQPFRMRRLRSLCCDGNARDRSRCRTLSQSFHHGLGKTAGSKTSSESKSHHRTETVGGRKPRKINARYRRLESRREHRATLDRPEPRTNVGTEELQSRQVHFVASRRNDVLSENFALAAIRRAQMQTNLPILDFGAKGRVSQQTRHPRHHILDEPSRRRTKGSCNELDTKPFRQIVKQPRRIGKETRA